MHRRTFLKRLAGALLATRAAVEFGAVLIETVKTKVIEWRANPAYETAPYEERGWVLKKDPHPARYEFKDGGFVRVEPFIEA